MEAQSRLNPANPMFDPIDSPSTAQQYVQPNDAYDHGAVLAMLDQIDQNIKSLDSSPQSSPSHSSTAHSITYGPQHPSQQVNNLDSPSKTNTPYGYQPIDLVHSDWRAEKARFWDTGRGRSNLRGPRRGSGGYKMYIDLDAPDAGPNGYAMPLSERGRGGYVNEVPRKRRTVMINPFARFLERGIGRRNAYAPLAQHESAEENVENAAETEAEAEAEEWSYEKEYAKSWLM